MIRAPHCDQAILHAPGTCHYCDMFPQWQEQRTVAGINFSNTNDTDKAPCPSTRTRTADVRDLWPGNRASM